MTDRIQFPEGQIVKIEGIPFRLESSTVLLGNTEGLLPNGDYKSLNVNQPKNIINEFNEHFEGDAKIEIKNKTISLTIGSRTIEIALPTIIGASGVGSKDKLPKP